MRRLGIYIAVLMATSSVALAAVSGSAGGATGKSSEQSTATAPASSKEQMYIGKPDQIRAGDKLFHQHCAACHGDNGRGFGKAADLTAPQVQTESPAELAEFLRHG